MLLPSPTQATGTSRRFAPNCSFIVMTSASSWQGCRWSVSPLMTGTEAYSANSSSSDCSYVRTISPST